MHRYYCSSYSILPLFAWKRAQHEANNAENWGILIKAPGPFLAEFEKGCYFKGVVVVGRGVGGLKGRIGGRVL